MWAIFIKPNSYDWQAADDKQGVVVSIAAQQNPVYGGMSYAVIEFSDGGIGRVSLPKLSDVVEGDKLLVTSETDKNNAERYRYQFKQKLSD